jgi:hypothetical protein
VLFLAQNILGLQLGSLFWSLALGLAGLFFLSVFFSNRQQWWGLIPGLTLLGVAVTVGLDALLPSVGSLFGGGIILGSIGLSFLLIYLFNRDVWAAIIPARVLLALAVTVSLENLVSDFEFVSLFFLGMALTFAVVAMLPTREGNLKWAWIPAGVLGLMGVIFGAFSGATLGYLWPLVLIIVGLFLVYQTLTSRSSAG